MIGEFEFAGLVLNGAGERALLEAEQLRLEQLGGQCCAIHLDERLVFAQRPLVQGTGDELFAGPALSADEHGDVRVRDLFDEVPDLDHRLAVTEEHRVLGLAFELLAE